MTIRTKLLLCFLGCSFLMIVASLTFYFQLARVIEPLTYNIPLVVEKLTSTLNINDFLYRFSYERMLAMRSFDRYMMTNQLSDLQDYYAAKEISLQLIKEGDSIPHDSWKTLIKALYQLYEQQRHILNLMQQGNLKQAHQIIVSSNYSELLHMIKHSQQAYYENYGVISDENSLVTVRLAAKKITVGLQNILTTKFIMLFLVTILSLLFAVIAAHNIARPIHLLRNNMERLSSGTINIEMDPFLMNFAGEVGDLARAFFKLIKQLQTTTVLRDELEVEVKQRKKTEAKLRQSANLLLETNKELDQFAYITSHDLRAPLRGIETIANWIQEDCYTLLPAKSQEDFNLLKKRVHRLDALITGILQYSRIGRSTSINEPVDVQKLLLEIIDSLSLPAHVSIHFDTEMPSFTTNKVALLQLFLNLISNGVKYNDKAQVELHIGCETGKKYYTFYVADNGPGIAPEFYERIFVIFQTLQSRDKIESTGIGLSIAKKIVEQQDGKIWLNSIIGQGTTFYFTWRKV